MLNYLRAHLLPLLSSAVIASGCSVNAQDSSTSAAPGSTAPLARASLAIQSPMSGETVQGVAIIRFRAENRACSIALRGGGGWQRRTSVGSSARHGRRRPVALGSLHNRSGRDHPITNWRTHRDP